MPVPEEVRSLVERFQQHREAYLSGQYNEAQLRREFLDPFFEALGWDVHNRQGYAEAYKDVIHEDTIAVGGATKAPDYCFRIGGTRKFFVEAKKPSINVRDEISPAFQLRRYAWSAKLPLSILTDFHELAVYDCRIKPDKSDKAATARVLYLTCEDYLERWDELAAIFSREAILKGSFDKYAESGRRKKGTAEVDDAFLAEIEGWRAALAQNVALRNPGLSQRELNFAVQRIIDRVIFLRICEDRGIEDYGQLLDLLKGSEPYRRLCEIFYRADQRFNSGLFHFQRERDRAEPPDELTLALAVDDKPLKEILRSLYYPDSPYEFSVLGADILGQVYEQFLGKVIRLTPTHRAVVEEKPEVRKAGGVYYTPTYIVDYIVRHTVGKMLESKTPPEMGRVGTKAAAPLRILDPACGSGSFLLGAYQYLLDWHRDWYAANEPAKWAAGKAPRLFQAAGGQWRLTTAERKRILLAHIYGVDIDPQAVEVTKLSLLLKVLEGPNGQTLTQQLQFLHERALPDLGRNIKCGNSLIGPDFYHNHQSDFFDEEERYRINAFDWRAEFPEVFPRADATDAEPGGGFDVVIGNPPYRMLQPHNTPEAVLQYLRSRYVAAEFKIEFFHLFLQKGLSLLRLGGRLGFILPTTLLNNVYAETLRRWILERCCIEGIAVALKRVFREADVHTSILTLRREASAAVRSKHRIAVTTDLAPGIVRKKVRFSRTNQSRFAKLPGGAWNIRINDTNGRLLARLLGTFPRLEQTATINRGLITGDRDRFFCARKESRKHVPILMGGDVQRYFTRTPSHFVLLDRPESAGGSWDPDLHLAPHKIVLRQIGDRPTASIVFEPLAVSGNIFTIRAKDLPTEMYLLGVINSTLAAFLWRILFADFKQSFPQITISSLSQLPVRLPDVNSLADQQLGERMRKLVDHMLSLQKRLAAARADHDRTVLQRQIAATDHQIDRLVYELHGLTEKEVEIVEHGATD